MSSLKNVWASYQVTRDSTKIARRAIEQKSPELLVGTDFVAVTPEEASALINAGRTDADDLFVLALWAVFERELRDHLEAEGPKPLQDKGSLFHRLLADKIRQEMEYWRNDDVLDLFKAISDPALIGQAKQIKQYRDWVAHKNPKHAPPANVTPQKAYDVLAEIIESLP
ncbi:MAG: hypothetical protein L3K26_09400 [Candidatus Hydrogenedentes bacterium]|nr:hypothetical protein [Candidatus Hydrogenedentota bacterium]